MKICSTVRDRRLLACVILVSLAASAPAAEPFRAYFIGNSVTDTVRYEKLAELAASHDIDLQWGRHMIPGAPLEWIFDHPDDGFTNEPFGHYPKALVEFAWDAVSIQPFDRQLTGKNDKGEERGDVAMIKDFAERAAKKNPEVQIFIYARWPRVTIAGKGVPFDKNDYDPEKPGSGNDLSKVDKFSDRWIAAYKSGWDLSNEGRDYFNTLLNAAREATPDLKKPIRLIPVGHVLADLDSQMIAGKIPGWTSIYQFYKDGIHLNEAGSYTVACTFFATMFGKSPVGLPSEPYGRISHELSAVIQETVWRIVEQHPEFRVGEKSLEQPKY